MMQNVADTNRLKARFVLGLLVMGVCVFGAGQSVFAQSTRDLSNRVNRLENEIETLSRALFRGEDVPAGSLSGGGSSDAAQANMEVRLTQMETELRDIRGQMEEQSYATRQLREELERMKGDLEMRINDLEGGKRSSLDSGGVNDNGMQYIDRSSSLATDSAERADSASTAYQWKSSNGAAESGVSGNTLGTYRETAEAGVATDNVDLAAATYENAFSLLKKENYDAAEKEFQAFLGAYPDHPLAGNAKYWLGETFYVRADYVKAARVFAEGYQKYPSNSKAADNLLKLGMSLSALGKKDDACVALSQIEKEGFKAAAPVLRRAKQEKDSLGC